jgi:hypothetical protein
MGIIEEEDSLDLSSSVRSQFAAQRTPSHFSGQSHMSINNRMTMFSGTSHVSEPGVQGSIHMPAVGFHSKNIP